MKILKRIFNNYEESNNSCILEDALERACQYEIIELTD